MSGYTVRVSRGASSHWVSPWHSKNIPVASEPEFGRGGTYEEDRVYDFAHHGNASLYAGILGGGSRAKCTSASGTRGRRGPGSASGGSDSRTASSYR